MLEYHSNDLAAMDQRYRAAFINSLGGFKSVALVGTANPTGSPNLAIFNSLFHIGANPPLMGLIVRPDVTERHTLRNIAETGHYTLNHLTETIFQQAHQTSARYPSSVSEFEAVGLTPAWKDDFLAPFVAESALQIGMVLREKIPLAINGTMLLIGEIVSVRLPEGIVQPDGFVDIEQAGSLACSGLDSYHRTERLARMRYAKPDSAPERL